MKTRRHLAVLSLGLKIKLAGFGYDLAFTGILYQDPTPEMAARFRAHSRIASMIEALGLLVLFFGLLMISIRGLWSLRRPIH